MRSFIALLIMLIVSPSFAQLPAVGPANEEGYKPYGAFDFDVVDSVNLMNLKLNLNIPIVSYPQRGGKLQAGFKVLYQSSSFSYSIQPCDSIYNVDLGPMPCQGPGQYFFSGSGGTSIVPTFGATYFLGAGSYSMLTTADGSNHDLYPASDGSGRSFTLDASGFTASHDKVTSTDGLTYRARHANTSFINPQDSSIQDPSGNQITYNHIQDSGGYDRIPSITDTIGRVIPFPSPLPGGIDPSPNLTDSSGCTGPLPIYKAYQWFLPGINGQTATYKLCYVALTAEFPVQCTDEHTDYWWMIGCPGTLIGGFTSSDSLQSIVLPNGKTWTFEYDTAYADLVRVTMPTGGTISYEWTNYGLGQMFDDPALVGPDGPVGFSRALASRTVDALDGSGPHTWTYKQIYPDSRLTPTYTVRVSDPGGNDTDHIFTGLNGVDSYYEVSTKYYVGSASANTVAKKVDTEYSFETEIAPNLQGSPTPRNILPVRITTTLDDGSVSKVEKSYDSGVATTVNGISAKLGNLVAEREYDYGVGGPGPLLRATNKTFKWQIDPAYNSAGLFNLEASTCIALANNTSCSGTNDSSAYETYGYDEAGSPSGPLGNPTSESRWLNTAGQMVTTSKTFDSHGMPVSATDAMGNTTLTTYDSTGMFVSNVQAPTVNGVIHKDYYSYDFNTGVLLSHTDPNGSGLGDPQHSTTYTYDIMNRKTHEGYPDGGGVTISYNGDPVPAHVTVTTATGESAGDIVKDIWFDGKARPTDTQLTSDPDGAVHTKTVYDAFDRTTGTSNPYRSGDSVYYSTTTYDTLGRALVKTKTDGNTQTMSYTGAKIDSWDERGVHMQHVNDGLGRLIKVMELGTVTQPVNLETDYVYDVLSNLSAANQHGTGGEATRSRTFVHDSLSRLITSANPETGTICYGQLSGGNCLNGYDANGNLLAKTDARGIATYFHYDPLSRLDHKWYSDSTTPQWFGYDGNNEDGTSMGTDSLNAVGRLSTTSNKVNVAAIMSYDPMGRLERKLDCIPNSCWNISESATYDLTGNLTQLIYPDGRSIANGYDSAGRLNKVSAGTPASPGSPYISDITYHADGSPYATTYGNNVQETVEQNTRLQVQSFRIVSLLATEDGNPLTSSGPSTNSPFLSHDYCYSGCTTGGTANNGNIWGITDNLNSVRTQGFTYDSLNRISNFYHGGTLNQQYTIDSFGNMSPMSGGVAAITFSPTTNRISNLPCASSMPSGETSNTWPFYPSGEQRCDTDAYGAVRTYGFDAEGRIARITSAGTSTPFETYVYDAQGTRVRKDNADGTFTGYVNFNGLTIAEKDQTGYWKDYIHAGGRKVAMAFQGDQRIRLSGTNSSASGDHTAGVLIPSATGYVIRPSDVFHFSQAGWGDSGATLGGIDVQFCDGISASWFSSDQNGNMIDSAFTTWGQWDTRIFDFNIWNGETICGMYALNRSPNSSGHFEIGFNEIAITSTDGVTTKFYSHDSTPTLSVAYATNVSGAQVLNEFGNPVNEMTLPLTTTLYYIGDHLGSQQMEFSASGLPLWHGEYAPFGKEIGTQQTSSHYKFTGKERDSESGLDYFGARYYASNTGRWMSPDWADKPEAVPYSDLGNPQSLNLYGYVNNNPLSKADADGHCPDACVIEGLTVGAIATYATVLATAVYLETPSGQRSLNTFASAFSSSVSNSVDTVKGWISSSSTASAPAAPVGASSPAADKPSTLAPGPYAGDSIPARGPQREFNPGERGKMNDIGVCHTCGATDPGTKSGNFVPDHQPVSSLNPGGAPQRLYPHCLSCSRRQGGEANAAKPKRTTEPKFRGDENTEHQ